MPWPSAVWCRKSSAVCQGRDKFIWGDFDGTVTRATNRRVQEVRLIPRKVQDENEK
mgnify:CR=1 FL=1